MTYLLIINIIVTVLLIYKLWNKRHNTHIHITTVVDHTGKIVGRVFKEIPDLLNSDPNVQERDATEVDSSNADGSKK